MNNIILKKGMKIRIDFNYDRVGDLEPDIQECFITSDDPPFLLSERDNLLVGRKMSEFYTISAAAFIHTNRQLTLF